MLVFGHCEKEEESLIERGEHDETPTKWRRENIITIDRTSALELNPTILNSLVDKNIIQIYIGLLLTLLLNNWY